MNIIHLPRYPRVCVCMRVHASTRFEETCQDVWINVPCAFAYVVCQRQLEGMPESVGKSIAAGHVAAKTVLTAVHVLPGSALLGATPPWRRSSSVHVSASGQGSLLPPLDGVGRRPRP